jgi:hypothetical protein
MVASSDPVGSLETFIASHVRGLQKDRHAEPSPEIAKLREQVDALEWEAEGPRELGFLTQELNGYVIDKRSELRELRALRWAFATLALICLLLVGGFLARELHSGFAQIPKFGSGEILPAAYLASSLAFVLAVLALLLRGVFGAVKDEGVRPFLPPHVQELYDVVRRSGH